MLARKLVVVASVLSGVLVLASASSATTVVRTDPGNALLSAGSTITGGNNGGTATFTSAAGSVSCGAFADGVLAAPDGNPSVTGTLTTFTLAPCVDTILAINILSCNAIAPFPAISVTAVAGGGTNTLTDLTKRCATSVPGKACYFTAATATASFTNANATLRYSGVNVVAITTGFTDAIVPANCGTSGTLSADFPDIHTTGGRTITVTTT
jgi:hypothetical protein